MRHDGLLGSFGAKEDKADVHYRKGSPERHCSVCTMFVKPHGCTAVSGVIEPGGLCDLFKKKK